MGFIFEWDARKAATNIRKHGVSFDEAVSVFADPLSLTVADPKHSEEEFRFIDIGLSHRRQLLVVSYTEREDRIRIISVRLALPRERNWYEEKNSN